MPSSSQTINIEGQDASNGFWKQVTQINQAGADAIQEVTIQTSNYAAEYGQAGGGYFNYTMKSGTNRLHGSGFDYFVNTVLNAGLPFTDDPDAIRTTTSATRSTRTITASRWADRSSFRRSTTATTRHSSSSALSSSAKTTSLPMASRSFPPPPSATGISARTKLAAVVLAATAPIQPAKRCARTRSSIRPPGAW